MALIKFDSGRAPRMPVPNSFRGVIPAQPVGMQGADILERGVRSTAQTLDATYAIYDRVGRQLTGLGESLFIADQETKLTNAQIGLSRSINDLYEKYQDRTDWLTMDESFRKDSEYLANLYGTDLRGKYSEKFQSDISSTVGSAYKKIKSKARKGVEKTFLGSLEASFEYLSRKAAFAPSEAEKQAYQDEYTQKVMSGAAGGYINPQDAVTRQIKFVEEIDSVRAKNFALTDPVSASLALRDTKMFPSLDPHKRLEYQQLAITKERQNQTTAENADRIANSLLESRQKNNARDVYSLAAVGKISLVDLRQKLVDLEITPQAFSHAETLIAKFNKGDIITNQAAYNQMWAAISKHESSYDEVARAENISGEDTLTLIKHMEAVSSSKDISKNPSYKLDQDIIKSTVAPGGLFNFPQPDEQLALANAYAQYDRDVRGDPTRGIAPIDHIVARTRAIAAAMERPDNQLYPAMRYGYPDQPVAELKKLLHDALYVHKTISRDAAEIEAIKIRRIESWQKTQKMPTLKEAQQGLESEIKAKRIQR